MTVNYIDYINMSKDSKLSDTAPILGQAARAQLAAMLAGVAARGYKDMTPAFATLIPLLDATGARSTVLARRAGISKQAMSKLIKQLESRDYVEQAADPTDTRAKVVRLTKRGVGLRESCMEVRMELHKAAFKALGKANLARLQRDLETLTRSMTPSKE